MKNLKNLAKKVFAFSIVLLTLFVIPFNNSFADTFYKNEINVKINKDGSADIESIMDFEPSKGTEYYIPIENLGKSEILNYNVSEIIEGKEVPYETLKTWNVKQTKEQKAKKAGIVKTKNGYELCFGFGEYKRKTFVLRYRVTNFIKLLKDSDMIYWQFVNKNLSSAPKTVKVTISKAEGKFDNANAKIWAFGNKGKIEFLNGKIVFNSLSGLSSSNYVTVLVKLNKGEITSGETINKDFSYYQDLAFKGSDYTKNNAKRKLIHDVTLFVVAPIVVFASFLTVLFLVKKKGYSKGDFKGEYYRDIPEKEWWKLSYILKNAGFDGNEAIFRAYFLKWIQAKLLIPITEEKGVVFKKDVLALKINEDAPKEFDTKIEEKFYTMVVEASMGDGILQEDEFSKYLKDEIKQHRFQELSEELEFLSLDYARENNLFDKKTNGEWTKKYNEKGKGFVANLIKYYNYLKDFSLLSEREISEIKVWKELLIYATLYDVTDVVEEQLRKLSPEVLNNINVDLDSFHTGVIYSDTFSNNFVDAYSSNVSSFFGGDGGYTSTGGGDDSFGGGDGGGTR